MRAIAIGLTGIGTALMMLGACVSIPGVAAAAAPPSRPAIAGAETIDFDFDIPAQPLDDALRDYAGVTGRPAMFRSSLVDGRTSAPVVGRHAPEAALRMLLAGTGLTYEDVGGGGTRAFVLKPAATAASGSEHAADPQTSAAGDGRVQSAVWQALCADPETVPGDYRALLRLYFDDAGRVRQASLLGSTGRRSRDAAIERVLQRVRTAPLPSSLAQEPVIMLVMPRSEIAGRACGKASGT